MNLKFYASVLAFSLITSVCMAQTIEFQSNSYEMINGQWHLVSTPDGQKFPIVNNTITLKYEVSTAESDINNFESQHNLVFLRKAITGWYDYEITGDANIFDVSTLLMESSFVNNLEIPTIGTYTIVPDDTIYPNMWHLNQANGNDIDAALAWDITTGDPSVIVAVLDSGVDWVHEDLGLGADAYQNIFLNPGEDAWTDPNDPSTGNGVDDDGNGLIDDWKGYNFGNNYNDARQDQSGNRFFHGSHVSGIVAGKTNNGVGVSGVAGGWNDQGAQILACAVGITGPNGSILDDAILYAAEIGAGQVQLSLSVGQSSAIDDAIDMAYDNFGVIIVNASGNNGSSSGVGYPASHPKCWAIGATTQSDLRASFSNHGTNLFISAPGTDIWSTQLTTQGSLYNTSSGTSFASPIASGIIALMKSVNPGITQAEVQQVLIDTAEKVGGYDYDWNPSDPGHSRELGYGRLNAFAAVQAAQLLSVEDFGTGNLFTLSPNPASDFIQIRLNDVEADDLAISIYTINGREVYAQDKIANPGSGILSVSVENLASGLYILQMSDKSSVSTAKFVVK